jgi:O-antigen/teichoic acid export membrane protein
MRRSGAVAIRRRSVLGRLTSIVGEPGDLRGQLARGAFMSLVIKVAYTLLTVGAVVLLARILGPHDFGVYAYAYALITTLALPAQGGLPALVIRQVAAYQVREEWGLMRGLLRRANQGVIVFSALLVIIAAGATWLLMPRLSSDQVYTFLVALGILPLLALASIRSGVLVGMRNVVIGQVPEQIVRPMLLIIIAGTLVLLHDAPALTPVSAMAAHLLAAGVAFGLGAWLLHMRMPGTVRSASPEYETRDWVRSVVPLSLLAGAQVLNTQMDVIILGLFRPSEDVGIYRVAAQGALLVAFPLFAISAALAPHISRLHAVGDKVRLQRMITLGARVAFLVALPLAVIFVVAGDNVLRLVFGESYARGHIALALLSAGFLLNTAAGLVATTLNMTGQERVTAAIFGLTSVGNILLNWILIPVWGMNGAAVATAITLLLWGVWLSHQVLVRLGIGSAVIRSPWRASV